MSFLHKHIKNTFAPTQARKVLQLEEEKAAVSKLMQEFM